MSEKNQDPLDPTTRPRLRQVAEMIAEGLIRRQVAGRLGVSVNTVREHVRRARRALGATGTGTGSVAAFRDALGDEARWPMTVTEREARLLHLLMTSALRGQTHQDLHHRPAFVALMRRIASRLRTTGTSTPGGLR